MTKRRFTACALVAMATMAVSATAFASSHRETPATWQDPCTDHTDLYGWVNDTAHDKLYLIQVYNGLHEPGQGNHQTSLCDDVLYEFHIANGVADLDQDITYQIRFNTSPANPIVPHDSIDAATPVIGGAELLVQLSGAVQTYTVTRVEWTGGVVSNRTAIATDVPVSPPNIGPRTDRLAYGLGTFTLTDPASSQDSLFDAAFMRTFVNDMGTAGDEGRVWVGEADDPFFLDEDAIFDVLNLRGDTLGVTVNNDTAKDVFAGFNAMAIALEIPTDRVTGTGAAPAHNGMPGDDTMISVWNTTSRRKVTILKRNGDKRHRGPWRQVSRQGLPLFNAALVGAQDQEKYLRTHPRDDVANFANYILYPVLVRDLDFLGVYGALGLDSGTVATLKGPRTDILSIINLDDIPSMGAHNVQIANGVSGDVLRIDLAVDSGFPNGRRLATDVSDVMISLVAAGDPAAGLGDNVNSNDVTFETEFPFLGVPHEGIGGGHGSPAP